MFDFEPTPEERQAMMASFIRGRDALAQASARGNRLSNMAAIAQLANNPGAAAAAESASKGLQTRHAPKQMGQQGFMLPESGEFIESPIYTQERMALRQTQRELAKDRIAAQQQAQAERAAAAAALQQMRDDASAERQRERLDAQAQLRLTLAAIAAGNAPDKTAQALEKDLQRYTGTIDKAGIPELANAAGSAVRALQAYKPGELPGYGRLQGLVPDPLATNEMQSVRAQMQDAANIILKARSGAAVTGSEQQRFLRAVASGAGMSEEALRTGWNNVLQTIAARASGLSAGYRPEVHDEYVKRGGRDFRNFSFGEIPGVRVLPKSTQAPATASRIPVPAAAPTPLPTAEQLGLPPGFRVIGVQ